MAKSVKTQWPVLRRYDQDHLARIALPLGGIGTGTVSLGGRGDLRDWELMNRPAKGFAPGPRFTGTPFFALYAKPVGGEAVTRLLEGPVELPDYEGQTGSVAANHGLPRFQDCSFEAAYPLGQVVLSDRKVPVRVRLEAFNPLVPGDADKSGIPTAILRYSLTNRWDRQVVASVCGSLQNYVGQDGSEGRSKKNVNRHRKAKTCQGILMSSQGVESNAAQWGTIGLATTAKTGVSYRTAWANLGWGTSVLDFWDDFSDDGVLENRRPGGVHQPMSSLAARLTLPPRATKQVTFLITWHFPNRMTWMPRGMDLCDVDEMNIGNYYTTQYKDAWDVAVQTVPKLKKLEEETVRFVSAFCKTDIPQVAKEAALFNLSTLRSQTCFRTPDGRFYGFEGCRDTEGCCIGSCTHVWNYEQSLAFLFGDLSATMRDVEFNYTQEPSGKMSFRVNLPLKYSRTFGKAAADGQMGCIMKMYRDWQLSGDDEWLKSLWPQVKKALEFCWIKGGWDADRDGVMEGCQHNTMDVEYFGPNPQMGIWYLGALRAAQEMAVYLADEDFAVICGSLFDRGRTWMDRNLFNGEYYEHEIRLPKRASDIADGLQRLDEPVPKTPDYQLGNGCLVDQLIGQVMAHVCGLGYLTKPSHVRKTLRSILKYNQRKSLAEHFNCMRSYALGDESALLMASYPKGRLKNPFPYFTEVMTGFEYTAAIGMLYEGQVSNGLACIQDIRDRYDGKKRSPFDEAECGHHYARAMIAWAAPNALSGFQFSAVKKRMAFAANEGRFFWATGYAWGTCEIKKGKGGLRVTLETLFGRLELSLFELDGFGVHAFGRQLKLNHGKSVKFLIEGDGSGE